MVAGAIALAYYSTFEWLIEAWSEPESNYSHGYLVPIVIALMLWERRYTLAAVPKHNDARGLAWISLALLMQLAGMLLDVHFIQGLSLFPLSWGAALWYFGRHVMKEAFWPLAFIIFMIPLPYVQTKLTMFLQMVSAVSAAQVLSWMSFDIVRDGTIIRMPSFQLFVEAPCSGLNTLFSLIFVGSAIAYWSKGLWWRKLIMLLTAPLIAIIANIFRIVIIALLGEFYGEEVAMGVFHKGSGVIMYALGFVLFLAEGWLLKVRLTAVEGRRG